MSSPSKLYEEAQHNAGVQSHSDRLISVIAATIAVLAALGTLTSHHRSIEAINIKNEAILATAKANDENTVYQGKRVRVAFYQTLLAGDVIHDPKARARTQQAMDHEQASSVATLEQAQRLESEAEVEQQRSEELMNSFGTLAIVTTLFEIAIVLSSISALTRSRALLWCAIGLSALGLVLFPVGYFQGH